MRINDKKIVLIVINILFHLFILSNHGIIVEGAQVPPFNIKPEALKKFMQLEGGIKFDLPALYAFGDSYIDSGNKKVLNKLTPVLPYGIDFNHSTPTGRTTNGRTMLDFLAQTVGLPFPSTFLRMSDAEKKTTLTGINFACSSSGILPTTVDPQGGEILTLDKQIDNFESSLESLKSQFNGNTESFTNYMSKSLFFVSTGNNDLGVGYNKIYKDTTKYPKFTESLAEDLTKRLERLYKLGARKFLINEVIPLGSTPFSLIVHRGSPDNTRDNLISKYNAHLRVVLQKLQSKLPSFQYTIGDIYKVMMDAIKSPSSYGFTNTLKSCCTPGAPICKDRNSYVYFDIVHASEAMHFLIVKRYFKEPSLCSPLSFTKLIQA